MDTKTSPDKQKGLITGEQNEQPQAQSLDVSAIIERMNRLEAENEALKSAVGKEEFHRHLSGTKQDKRPEVRLMFIYDKDGNERIIKSWSKMLVDHVVAHNGEIKETQTTEVTYLDGKKERMSYAQAFNHRNRTPLLKVNRISIEPDGSRVFQVEINGEQHEINELFIN